MIEFDEGRGEGTVTCDSCPFSEDFLVYGDFMDLVEEAKASGWRFTKDNAGEWIHVCPDCEQKSWPKLKGE